MRLFFFRSAQRRSHRLQSSRHFAHEAEEKIYFSYIFYISKNKKSKCGGYFEMRALMRNLDFFLFGLSATEAL